MTARVAKMPRHDVSRRTALPRLGAAIGATPKISVRREKYRAAPTPE